VTITEDDKVSITSDQLLTPTGGLGYGFEGGVTLTGSGPYVATADGEWTRGTVEGFSVSYLYLNPGPTAGSVSNQPRAVGAHHHPRPQRGRRRRARVFGVLP